MIRDIKNVNGLDGKYIGLENIESQTGICLGYSSTEFILGQAYAFKKGDILFPKLRPYLNKVWLASFDGYCSTEFCVLRNINNFISNLYFRHFLNSDIVVNQTKHLMCGNTLPRLQIESINKLLIPLPSIEIQQQIVELMDSAYIIKRQKEKEANKLLDMINNYLLDELNIKIPELEINTLENRMNYVASVDVIGGRFDPKNYSTSYMKIFDAIKASSLDQKKLNELISFDISGNWGFDETVEDDSLIRCLTIRATEFDNRYNLKLDNSRVKYRKYKRHTYEKMNVTVGDILVEKSGGSEDQPVGRVAIIDKENAENYTLAFSNFIHKIVANEEHILADYLFEYLTLMHNIKVTEIMQNQTNGIRNLIMKEYFGQTILLPDKDKQKEIALYIKQIREKAKQLELEAKLAVDNAKLQVNSILLGE